MTPDLSTPEKEMDMVLARFFPVRYKRVRFAAGALLTFGCAFGLPALVEGRI